jgi:hypothetical protein
MASAKIQQLIEKYSANAPPAMTGMPTALLEESENRFKHQRQRISEFAHQLHVKLNVLIKELEYDISNLKDRGFDHEMMKFMTGIWNHLIALNRSFNQDKPYETAKKLVAYVMSRNAKSIIENLDFIAKHHMKKTNVDFIPGQSLVHPEIKSLQLLLNFTDYLNNYMKINPLLGETVITPAPPSPTSLTPTFRPPAPIQPAPVVEIPKDEPVVI